MMIPIDTLFQIAFIFVGLFPILLTLYHRHNRYISDKLELEREHNKATLEIKFSALDERFAKKDDVHEIKLMLISVKTNLENIGREIKELKKEI